MSSFINKIPLLSPLAAAKGLLLLQASTVSLGSFTLCVSVPGAVGSLWDPGSTPAALGREEEDRELDFLSQALPAIVRERQREERGAVVRC